MLIRRYQKYVWFLSAVLIFSYVAGGFHWCTAHEEITDTSLSAEEFLLQSLQTHRKRMDMRAWNLSKYDVMRIFQELMEKQPHLFFVSSKLTYAYDESGIVTDIYPQYRMSEEETQNARAELLSYLNTFADTVHPDMSDGDKALLIHDHMAEHYTYSPIGEENYDIYSLLRDGHGVCQALSLMYMALGARIGLAVDLVTSDAMDHAWNHVKIGENYYHVDITRDLSDIADGGYHHDRFLLCDEALISKGYMDFSCRDNHICDSHTYEVSNECSTHIGLMHNITGSSVYVCQAWLSYRSDHAVFRISLNENDPSEDRLEPGADLNRDGRFSLSDLLAASEACDSESSISLINMLRKQLLENTISSNN